MHKVSIVRVKNNCLDMAIAEAMELVDWKSCVKQHGRICVKPNMGNLTNVPAVITRPDFVHHVVKILKTWADEVIVGESDGTHYNCDEAFVRTGVKDAVEAAQGRVINFSHDEQVKVPIQGLYWREVTLPKTIVNADSFVTLPVIKTHETTLISCAIKNQFGCIANRNRCLYHHHLHEILADINLAIKPDLVVTDGTYCMEGNGPIHGAVKQLDIVMASDDVVANDLVACHIMKVPFTRVEHLMNSMRAGFGARDWRDIEMPGLGLGEFNNVRFQPIHLDLIAKILIKVTNTPILTRVLLLSPLFPALKKATWFLRGLKGMKPRV